MARIAVLTCLLACNGDPASDEVLAPAWADLDHRLDAAVQEWRLDDAASLLAELEASGAPPERIDNHRREIASRLVLPGVYGNAPALGQRSTIELFPQQAAGTSTPSCGAAWGAAPIYAVDPVRARDLFRSAGPLHDELDAAYRAGELGPFEDAWARASADLHTLDAKARRARILAHNGKTDEAIAQAEEVFADPTAAADNRCPAALLVAKLHEQRGELDIARSDYERALASSSLGQCRQAAEARVATLKAGPPIAQRVRIWIDAPSDAKARVVLMAHPPSAFMATLHGWMGDDDPASWHNADTFVAIAGQREGSGSWLFPAVLPGSYGIVIVVEGAAAARPAPEQCVAGIMVENAPVEQSTVRIVWE